MKRITLIVNIGILFLTLTFLLLSVTSSLAADVEVTDIKIEWGSSNYGRTSYKACVEITNREDVRYQVYVKLNWYDSYGYKIHYRSLGDPVRPHSSRILCVYGGVDNHDVKVFSHLKAVIDGIWEVPKQ